MSRSDDFDVVEKGLMNVNSGNPGRLRSSSVILAADN